MARFELKSDYQPRGDQPQAIAELVAGIERGDPHQVLLGVTGSGKTFTMANVIAAVQRPTLVLAHNKTLAAQLYGEFKELFPDNAVEYFVSYYDYYQPEAYVPVTDTYIEKDSSINEEIDKLRHSATRSLLTRRDVLIVAWSPASTASARRRPTTACWSASRRGWSSTATQLLTRLVEMQYERNDVDFHRGTFRVRGDAVEVFPAYEEDRALCGSNSSATRSRRSPRSTRCAAGSSTGCRAPPSFPPATTSPPGRAWSGRSRRSRRSCGSGSSISASATCLLEAQRLEQRTIFDLEMMEEMGFCQGIENYSRLLDGRPPGEPPPTLLDYFPEDSLLFIDESHVTVPQVGAMYRGDRSRKETLVDFGFRLPSALDNRPLNFEEFEAKSQQTIYVSATPADYELNKAAGVVVEQIIRPTGLIDPAIEVRPARDQVDDLLDEIRAHRRAGRAGAGHHPDQADGRGPDRLPTRSCGSRCATCTRTSTPSSAWRSSATCARASSTCWSASTCCARGSTSPRSPWWPSSTPTRRASCAASAR